MPRRRICPLQCAQQVRGSRLAPLRSSICSTRTFFQRGLTDASFRSDRKSPR